LNEAIDLATKTGDWEKFCELCIEANEWEKAIMAAPHVSIAYWQELLQKYSKHTIEKNTNEKLFSALLTNQSQPIVNMLMENGEYEHAKLVWLTRYGLTTRPEGVNTSYPLTKDIVADIENKLENLTSNDELYKITYAISKDKLTKGLTIQAACAYLSIKDYFNTFKCLIRSNELEIAYMLMKSLKYDLYEDDIMIGLAMKSLRAGRTETFFSIVERTHNPEAKAIIICILKYFKSGSEYIPDHMLGGIGIKSELLKLIVIGDIHKACNLFKEHFDEFAESIVKGKLNLDSFRKICKSRSHFRVINFNAIDK
jgi:hypothetical protein